MSTTTSDSFVDLLEKSQLLSSERIVELRASANGASNPKALAQRLVKEKHLTRWQAAMLLRGRHVLRLGKYRLLEPVSSGELGDIYLAKHEQMGRRVAIHLLSRQITDDAERVERFLADSQSVAKLDHRNIIHVYDIDKEGDRYFIVMEHTDGKDLAAMLEEQERLAGEEAAVYIQQALHALGYAHQHDVLHLGLRPSNIAVEDEQAVKVRNFGMASLAEAFAASGDEHAVEKNRYAAPEQREGGEVDHRADICSLGIIGFQLLTGQLPTASAKRTNSTLEKIFRKMMTKRPEDRFQTAAEAADYLDRWLKKYRMKKCFAEPVPEELEAPPKPAKPLPQAKNLNESKDELAAVLEALDGGSESNGEVSLFGDDLSSLEQQGDTVGDAPLINTDFTSSTPAAAAEETKTTPPPRSKDEPDEDDAAEPKSAKSRTGLIIGIGGGLAALIIIGLVVALIIVINSKDDSQPVAKGGEDPPAAPTADDASDNEAEDDNPDEADQELTNVPENGNGDGIETKFGKDGAPLPTADQVATESNPGDAQDVSVSSDSGTGNPAAPAAPGNGTENGDPMPDPKPMPKADPKPEAKPKPEPKPEPKPKPPPKPADPFAGLAGSFDLPPLGNEQKPVEGFTEPVEVGTVIADAVLDVGLLGGEGAYRGKKMILKFGDFGLSRRKYELFVTPSSVADDGELLIAKLWIDENNKLLFQWTQEAQAEVASNALRNCLLEFRAPASIHALSLRKPVAMEPLVLDLEKGGAQTEAVIESMPDGDQVRMEVVGITGKAPTYRFDDQTGQVLDLGSRGANTRMWIGEPNQELLFFKITAATKGRDRVEVTVLPQVAIGPKPVTYSRKKIEPVLAQLQFQHGAIVKTTQDMEKSKEKDRLKQRIAAAKQQANLLGQQVAALQGMLKAADQLTGSQIAVRIYFETQEGNQILLASAGKIDKPKGKK